MKYCVIVQAQLTNNLSHRDDILFEKDSGGCSIIEKVVMQLKKSNFNNIVILSSSGNMECSELEVIKNSNIKVYKNSNNNLFEEYKKICEIEKSEYCIRIIANNIFLEIEFLEKVLEENLTKNAIDYMYFEDYPKGILASEIISYSAFNLLSKDDYNIKDRYIFSFIRKQEYDNINILKVKCMLKKYYDYNYFDFSYNEQNKERIPNLIECKSFDEARIFFKKELPNIVSMYISSGCNLKCKMCHQHGSIANEQRKQSNENISYENFKKVFDKFTKVEWLNLFGGEPLLNKDILLILEYARDKTDCISLTTSGTLLNEENSSSLVKNLDCITISIDGYGKEYEFIRGYSFDEIYKNLEIFINLNNEQKNKKVKVCIKYICMESNYRNLLKFLEIMSRFDNIDVQFSLFNENSFFKDKDLMNSFKIKEMDKLEKLLSEAQSIGEKNNIKVIIGKEGYSHRKNNDYDECIELKNRICITPGGYVLPCCVFFLPEEMNFGNMLHDDIENVLYKFKEFRWNVYSGNIQQICKDKCSG